MSLKRLRKYVRCKVSEIKNFIYVQWRIFWFKREERKHEKLFWERHELFIKGYEKYKKEMKERGEETDSLTPFDYVRELSLDETEDRSIPEKSIRNNKRED